MADEQPEKKRVIRAKSETVRERAEKSVAQEAKPRRLHATRTRVSAPFKAMGRPIKKVGRFVIPPYFRNSWKELRQVTWPNRKDSLKLTFAVLVFSFVFGALVAVVDYGLDKLFKQVLLK